MENIIYQDSLKLKNVNKVHVVLSLPSGAHFFKNINILVYQKLIEFIYKMNCLAPQKKCIECPLSSSCRYYHYTGENFRYYPGILIANDFFQKSIYDREECITFDFYLIGNTIQCYQYIQIFFEDYLQQKVAGALFYVKSIQIEQLEETEIHISKLKFTSIVDDDHFFEMYNNMINYYNQHYQCQLNELQILPYELKNVKKINLNNIQLKTKKIILKGILYNIVFQQEIKIPSSIKTIGIGIYNMIGGGYFEN